MIRILCWVAVFFAVYFAGWNNAHRQIARECDRLGAFFVKQNDYTCQQVNQNDEPEEPLTLPVPPAKGYESAPKGRLISVSKPS